MVKEKLRYLKSHMYLRRSSLSHDHSGVACYRQTTFP